MGLRVEHVDKSFAEVHVITDLSMEVREGSLFGFLGPNGAGKTTTMRMILDILRPDSGRITWNGQDVSNVRLVGDCAHHRADARGHLPLRGHLGTHLPLRGIDVRAKAGTEATIQAGTGGIGI
jgi:ABC-type branched-subunit amino acid transport system ATPase component